MYLWVYLTIGHHWFSYWFDAEQAKSHYQDQGCPVLRRNTAQLETDELTGWKWCLFSLIVNRQSAACKNRLNHVEYGSLLNHIPGYLTKTNTAIDKEINMP